MQSLIFITDIGILSAKNIIISLPHYDESIKEHESDRLNKVYDYIIKNYRSKIPLEKMADMLHMTPTSFSRYFSMKNRNNALAIIAEGAYSFDMNEHVTDRLNQVYEYIITNYRNKYPLKNGRDAP